MTKSDIHAFTEKLKAKIEKEVSELEGLNDIQAAAFLLAANGNTVMMVMEPEIMNSGPAKEWLAKLIAEKAELHEAIAFALVSAAWTNTYKSKKDIPKGSLEGLTRTREIVFVQELVPGESAMHYAEIIRKDGKVALRGPWEIMLRGPGEEGGLSGRFVEHIMPVLRENYARSAN